MKVQYGTAQYAIWFKGQVIESTNYLPSLQAAKKFARARYGKTVLIEAVYPPTVRDGVKHKV